MTNIRRIVALGVVVLVGTLLAACGGSESKHGEALHCYVGGTMRPVMEKLAKLYEALKIREAGLELDVLNMDVLFTEGQYDSVVENGITQARAFSDAVSVTGVVLTKLDGTAKGGIAIAVERELDIPIKYIGVGEGMDDLVPFVPDDFVEALITS